MGLAIAKTMNMRILLSAASATLLVPLGTIAADALTSMHPEEAYPDNVPPLVSPGPYTAFNRQVQEKLHEQGFDAGPVNGDFGSKTQAALAQFQLSRALPASGQLDDQTLAELGMQRGSQASAGASSDSSAGTIPPLPADPAGGGSSAEGRELGGSCDALVGPEKERCVQQGGTIEAGAKSSGRVSGPDRR